MFLPLTMQRVVINRLNRIITSSVNGVAELRKAFGLPARKISVVYNGMDVEMFRNTGEPREENSLLFVGNTEDHKKGMRYLFEALAMLPDEVTLTIVDEGPPSRLTAWGMIQDLLWRVTFTGKVDLSTLVSLTAENHPGMSSLHEGFGPPRRRWCETPLRHDRRALPEVEMAVPYWFRLRSARA